MLRRMRRRTMMLLAVGLLVVVAACADDAEGDGAQDPSGADEEVDPAPGVDIAGPFEPGADWDVREPDAVGMDGAALEAARGYAFAEGRNTQGVVVVRDGVIVAEWYDDEAGEDSWAASWSVGKSFTSALVGIAVEEGFIPSVDEPMTTYFPQWEGMPREDITLRDVLQMASGLDFTESYDPSDIESSDIIQMVLFQEDQLAYATDRPSLHPPGTEFNYSSGDTQLLSGVIEQATGMTAGEYAREKLFDPIGIEQVEWWEDTAGNTLTYCCLDTTSRDFARFGLLYLNEGAWGDQQVVPKEWVADSLASSDAFEGYGYQWWLSGNTDDELPADTFSARGHDGQYIYVIPSLDLVVVRNGVYIKYDGEPVADPNLFARYPNSVVEDLGTVGMDPDLGWDDAEFLAPIVDSASASG
jgi:CubicO group peptidase (beta-lactamase class C family)